MNTENIKGLDLTVQNRLNEMAKDINQCLDLIDNSDSSLSTKEFWEDFESKTLAKINYKKTLKWVQMEVDMPIDLVCWVNTYCRLHNVDRDVFVNNALVSYMQNDLRLKG